MAMTTMQRVEIFQESSDLLNDPEALKARAEEDGYLFFKGLLNPGKIFELRKSILKLCQKNDWLDNSKPLLDAIAKAGISIVGSSDKSYQDYYSEILSLRDFHALAQDPAIFSVLEAVFGEAVLAHPRNICRTIFPGSTKYTTPPHQDNIHIGGTIDTWTCWIPCGDCPETLGGLALVPGSHKNGLLETQEAYGAGGKGVEVSGDALWHAGAFECGDALFMHSLTVHQGRDNTTPDKLRISLDFRYQPLSHPVRKDSLEPHYNGRNWEELYAAWKNEDDLKYYWEKMELNII